jgi:hypothetical protein
LGRCTRLCFAERDGTVVDPSRALRTVLHIMEHLWKDERASFERFPWTLLGQTYDTLQSLLGHGPEWKMGRTFALSSPEIWSVGIMLLAFTHILTYSGFW